MESYFEGAIFSGTIDADMDEFILDRVKSIDTQSVVTKEQLEHLYLHLVKVQKGNEAVLITVNDQIPLKLSPEEIEQLITEIKQIMPII